MGERETGWSVTPPVVPGLAVEGSDARFPVGRIFCVGRNYADHALEMGADPVREPPFFFMKQSSALLTDGAALPYPPRTASLHHEVELVVAIGTGGSGIAPADALDHIFGYAVGIDMTRRDLQDEAKAKRRPWDVSKSFDGAAPVGAIVPGRAMADDIGISLSVDGTVRQTGKLGAMIWSVPEIIAELSTYQALLPGDLIFTGTPAGVGAVEAGQVMHAEIETLPSLSVRVA